jgi:DNA-binding IclR family transcriptional regulator
MTGSILQRTLAILELFTEERLEWTPEAMMDALGYSRPTLYRYLKTLRETGFLVSLPGAGFTLGPRVVELDFLLRKSDPLILAAQPHLEALAERHPCTALLVRWFGNRILCVASECSTPNPVSSYPRGRPMPLVRGAIPRSILANLPRARLRAMIETHQAAFSAIGLGEDADAIHERFRQVRRAGVAIARGEVTPGVVGIAAPVFDASRTPIASLCITLAAERAPEARIPDLANEIRDAAAAVSARLSRHREETAASAPVDARQTEPT